MSHPRSVVTALCLAAVALALGTPGAVANPVFGYEVETDVVYAQGRIAPEGVEIDRDLMLDVYTPSETQGPSARPAVILVHGGAHHRGGRRQPPFREDGAVHSRMEDYARLLAPRGYVCFVIEYRLALEHPQPDATPGSGALLPLDEVVTSAGMARTNFAREAMGLPVLADDERILLWNAVMAATEDLARAVEFVRAHSDAYGVDPDRIAVGGHSAGGGMALNAALGLKAPVAAVFPMSPPNPLFDWTMIGNGLPPTLVLISQYDVPITIESAPETISRLRAAGSRAQLAWVPGFPHFYPHGAVSLGDDGTRRSVGERIMEFLDLNLKQ